MNKSIAGTLLLDTGILSKINSGGAVSVHLGVQARVVRQTDAFACLRSEWRELFQRAGCRNPFLCPEWLEAWWLQWGSRHRLFLIEGRNRSGKLVAIAPLYVRVSDLGTWAPTALCFLGSQRVGSDHLGFLIDTEYQASSLNAIIDQIDQHQKEWGYIELADGEEAAPLFGRLRESLKGLGLNEVTLSRARCPYTPLPASFEPYLASLSSNVRYNFRRRWRALEREGGRFVALHEGPELTRRFADLVRLHRLRYADQRKRSAFLATDVLEFHARALNRMEGTGNARLFLLEVGGQAVAALYGFSSGRTFSFYQSGMDPAWSRMSVGLVMMGLSIEEAIRTGHDEFDFLRGDEAYKFQWTTQTRQALTACFYRRTFRGHWARVHVWLREHVKRVVRRYALPVFGLLQFWCFRVSHG